MCFRNHYTAKQSFARSLREQFGGYHTFGNFVNPLDPGIRCRKV